MIKLIKYFLLFSIILVSACFITNCDTSSDSDPVDSNLFRVTTADGLTVKMMRYRPADDAAFRKNQQPILLFHGLIGNMNEFLSHTPEKKKDAYADMELPDSIADWARGEKYVANDPMKYYSIAHYLWVEGYDVWLANNRGVGRGDFKSDKGNKYTNIDIWATLDAPACIAKVREVTGLKPVIGGHSTGALISYLYLQGVYMDIDEYNAANGEYNPHVKIDSNLALQRNSEVKGFLGIDPSGVPPLPVTYIIDTMPVWAVMGLPLFVNLDEIVESLVGETTWGAIPYLAVETLMGTVNTLAPSEGVGILASLDFWEVKNSSKYAEDFFVRYAAGSFYLRIMAQYSDWGVHNVLREFYKNGEENKNRNVPPNPGTENDNLLSYNDNMHMITVPAFYMFSESSGLVDTDLMISDFVNAKTYNENDEWYELPGSGHIDVPIGNNAPTYFYPKLGAWLKKID